MQLEAHQAYPYDTEAKISQNSCLTRDKARQKSCLTCLTDQIASSDTQTPFPQSLQTEIALAQLLSSRRGGKIYTSYNF